MSPQLSLFITLKPVKYRDFHVKEKQRLFHWMASQYLTIQNIVDRRTMKKIPFETSYYRKKQCKIYSINSMTILPNIKQKTHYRTMTVIHSWANMHSWITALFGESWSFFNIPNARVVYIWITRTSPSLPQKCTYIVKK